MQLSLDVSAKAEIEAQLTQRGMVLLSAHAERERLIGKSTFNLDLFMQELLALLKAGLSIIETIETLADKETRDSQKTVYRKIISALYEGQTFSEALAAQPECFTGFLVAIAKASEQSGQLVPSFERFRRYSTQLSTLQGKLISAAVYPLLITAIGGSVLLFLMMYVVPKFSQLYATMKNLPFVAEMMMRWGGFAREHTTSILLTIFAGLVGVVMFVGNPVTRGWLVTQIMRLPKLSYYGFLFTLTRFYRTTGMLISGGIPAMTAFRLSAPLLPARFQGNIKAVLTDLGSGQAIASVMQKHGLTTPVALRMLNVAEKSGELGPMLERTAEFYDGELDRAVDMFSRIFEPTLMLFVGVLIGAIVFMLYMPIIELASAIQ